MQIIIYFQEGFETIDAAFDVFLEETSIEDFKYYSTELQTTAKKYFASQVHYYDLKYSTNNTFWFTLAQKARYGTKG